MAIEVQVKTSIMLFIHQVNIMSQLKASIYVEIVQ